jgi:hypothetical protein
LEIIAEKQINKSDKEITQFLLSVFKLYKNGITNFEESLESFFKKEFINKALK